MAPSGAGQIPSYEQNSGRSTSLISSC
jgi:hypothetical protein